MSASYLRRCAGKHRYESKTEAATSRAGLVGSKGWKGNPLDVYRCDQCLGWHVGNAKGKHMTRLRRRGKRPNKRLRGRV